MSIAINDLAVCCDKTVLAYPDRVVCVNAGTVDPRVVADVNHGSRLIGKQFDGAVHVDVIAAVGRIEGDPAPEGYPCAGLDLYDRFPLDEDSPSDDKAVNSG